MDKIIWNISFGWPRYWPLFSFQSFYRLFSLYNSIDYFFYLSYLTWEHYFVFIFSFCRCFSLAIFMCILCAYEFYLFVMCAALTNHMCSFDIVDVTISCKNINSIFNTNDRAIYVIVFFFVFQSNIFVLSNLHSVQRKK